MLKLYIIICLATFVSFGYYHDMVSLLLQSHIVSNNHYLTYQWDNDCLIVILHGRGGSSASWVPVGEWLAKLGYSVLIPDLPWFGETPLSHAFTIDDYAHWIQDMMVYYTWLLKYKKVVLLWHSNGWRIATYAVSQGILYCDYLILNNAAGIPIRPPHTLKKMIFWRWKKVYHVLPCLSSLRTIWYRYIGWHDYLEAEKNPLLKQTFLNMLDATYPDEVYKSISSPTLILRWEHDSYTPLWMSQKIASLIPNNTFVICRWQKHGIHLTDPESVVKEIDQFIKS